jgi:predicted dehydrogenase
LSGCGWGSTLPGVRIGILGCGHVSDQYFEGLALDDSLTVVACADLDRARAEQKAAEHGVPRTCSPDELLADAEVELIVNLTPPQAHAQVSLAAIEAGKHVWSEKPLATNLEDGRALVDAATRAGVRLGCAPDTFLGGGLQTAIKLVDDGWIGDTIAGGVAMVTEPGYESWHPDVGSFYREGGGPILDLGPYYVAALVAILGPVARVTSMARATFAERTVGVGPRRGERIPVEVPTHVTGALEFGTGAIVTLLVSWDVWATNLPGHVRDPPHVGARAPAAHVDHDAAPEQQNDIPARELCARQPVQEGARLAQCLVPLAARDRGHLGLDAGLLECSDHERPVQLRDRLVGDAGHASVADRLEQPLDRLLRGTGDEDRIGVAALRPGDDLLTRRRELDRVDRPDLIATQYLDRHAASVRRAGPPDHPSIG